MSKIPDELVLPLIYAGASVVTGTIAWFSGAFSLHKVQGPDRLEEGVSGLWLALVLGGLLVILLTAASVRTEIFGIDRNKELAEIFVYGVSMIGWLALVRLLVRGGMRSLGIWPVRLGNLWRGPANIALALPWVMLMGWIGSVVYFRMHGALPVAHERLQEMSSESTSTMLKMLTVLSSAIGAPMLEEAMFRGTLQTLLVYALTARRRIPGTKEWLDPMMTPLHGRWLGIVGTAFIFALMHMGQQPAYVPALLLLGVVLGYSYERTGNYWVPVTIHALFNGFNLAMVVLFSAAKQGA